MNDARNMPLCDTDIYHQLSAEIRDRRHGNVLRAIGPRSGPNYQQPKMSLTAIHATVSDRPEASRPRLIRVIRRVASLAQADVPVGSGQRSFSCTGPSRRPVGDRRRSDCIIGGDRDDEHTED
jgi:hypothetical protein